MNSATIAAHLDTLEARIGPRPVSFYKEVERRKIRRAAIKFSNEAVRAVWLGVVVQTAEDFINRWNPKPNNGFAQPVSDYWLDHSEEWVTICEAAGVNPVAFRAEMFRRRADLDAEKEAA